MNEKIRQQYDSLYGAKEHAFRSGEPERLLRAIETYLVEGNVLDIGAGQGANALYLAERGYSVMAVDISETGLQQLREESEARGLTIETKLIREE
jgi:2-polyprenyl-3-methyl-5-hydroxy-6-metoxy-1,4-benzoquinol methylase